MIVRLPVVTIVTNMSDLFGDDDDEEEEEEEKDHVHQEQGTVM